MKALLLCAGYATRMYPLTENFPKPLLEVAGRTILDDLLAQLQRAARFESFVIVTNDRYFERFTAWQRDRVASASEPRIEVLNDGTRDAEARLGAVADIEFAIERAALDAPLLIAAADNLFRIDLPAFFEDYARAPRNLVLAAEEHDLARLRRSGVAEIGEAGRLVKLWEKPAEPPSRYCCPPLYLLEADALAAIGVFRLQHPDADAPGHWIAWLAEHLEVFTHEMHGARLDVGDVESYRGAAAWLDSHSLS